MFRILSAEKGQQECELSPDFHFNPRRRFNALPNQGRSWEARMRQQDPGKADQMGSKFCPRCRWSKVAIFLLMLVAGLLTSNAVGFWDSPAHHVVEAGKLDELTRPLQPPDPRVAAIDALLQRFEIDPSRRKRVAEAIVLSSSRHHIDPRLIASVMIVESRGNPFAISSRDAVGIMQIHVPTWARTVDEEGINLFKIEDNVEFGVRILRRYIEDYGHDEGIKRYNGWNPATPEASTADAYLQKVTQIYNAASER
jgi:hypothetical protein